MYDVRMVCSAWNEKHARNLIGAESHITDIYTGIYLPSISRCSFECKLSVTRHAYREIGFACTAE